MVIYIIKNLISNKIYIGQTTKLIKYRWQKHLQDLKKNRHCNRHLQNSWNENNNEKYWLCNVICQCNSINDLNEKETYFINYFKSWNRKIGYNLQLGGKNKFHSEESKKLISKSKIGIPRTQEVKDALKCANLGKKYGKRSDEVISNMIKNHAKYWQGKTRSNEFKLQVSEKLKGDKNFWFGKTLSDEHRKKISESLKNRKK
jgi:group I intron endonuclease